MKNAEIITIYGYISRGILYDRNSNKIPIARPYLDEIEDLSFFNVLRCRYGNFIVDHYTPSGYYE